ncbi:MAG: LacI family transcriptional regulator [Melioribacteraceae bacterium]|nr:LacI family transcriptional regulator [Melioribacteraceae bacterium]MCF8264155.1 LacI family transcriptional regulator [Melioribacteraceae bacterium]
MSKAVKLIDIAHKLNYSVVTISKALRDHPDISNKTRDLIKKVAEEMGYSPNLVARSLSSRKSNIIGLVVPKIAHHFFGQIIQTIYDIGFEHNYEILLMVSQEEQERERKHLQTLLAMKVDGIIISITEKTRDYKIFETIKERGVPLVFMDRIPDMERINSVRVTDYEGAYNGTEHLIRLGYKNIGHFGGYQDTRIGRDRYNGFKNAMDDAKIPINPNWVKFGGFSEDDGFKTFSKLVETGNLPDAILAATYPIALGVYMAAKERKIKIPNDIDIICFGDANIQRFLEPALSCIQQPTKIIAEKSMEILFDLITNPKQEKFTSEIVPTKLIIRETASKCNRL